MGSAGLSATYRPDFSGTWSMDLAWSEAAAQGTPIKSVTVLIRQTPGEVRVETTRDGSTELVRYLLSARSPRAPQERVGLFKWDGQRARHHPRRQYQRSANHRAGNPESERLGHRDDGRDQRRRGTRLPDGRKQRRSIPERVERVKGNERLRQGAIGGPGESPVSTRGPRARPAGRCCRRI